MDKAGQVFDFLCESRWLAVGGPEDVRFLAAGEYNENYLVRSRGRDYVLRINHGSQLGLSDQIGYEFRVLRAVSPSGVTPRPLKLDAPAPLGKGVLLMEYLPGRALDYATDLGGAARTFARIHSLPPDFSLVVQANPVLDIAAESLGLIMRYPDHPMADKRRRLLAYHEEVLALGLEHAPDFAADPLVMVNTEVNSGNFLVHEGLVRLVDWEKAVVSHRYQDLGHFLVPTTTLWKTNHALSPEERMAFLQAYAQALPEPMAVDSPEFERLDRLTRVLERTILLRALSWCFMAHYEYTGPGRELKNADTFRVMTRYLDRMEWFLQPTA